MTCVPFLITDMCNRCDKVTGVTFVISDSCDMCDKVTCLRGGIGVAGEVCVMCETGLT